MRGRHLLLVFGLSAAALPVVAQRQGLPTPGVPYNEVIVRVWRGDDRCSVFDRRVKCGRVPGMLQGSLQIGRERVVYVTATTLDDDVQIRAAQLVTEIKAAGYTRAVLVDTERPLPRE